MGHKYLRENAALGYQYIHHKVHNLWRQLLVQGNNSTIFVLKTLHNYQIREQIIFSVNRHLALLQDT